MAVLAGLSGLTAGLLGGMQQAENQRIANEDKARLLARQSVQDQQAAESHKMQMQLNQQQLDSSKQKNEYDQAEHQRLYAYNQYAPSVLTALEGGDKQAAVSAAIPLMNDPVWGLPYTVNAQTGPDGKIQLDKDGKASLVRTYKDGRTDTMLVDPEHMGSVAMAIYKPETLQKLHEEANQKQQEQQFDIKKIGLNHKYDMEKLKETGNNAIRVAGIKKLTYGQPYIGDDGNTYQIDSSGKVRQINTGKSKTSKDELPYMLDLKQVYGDGVKQEDAKGLIKQYQGNQQALQQRLESDIRRGKMNMNGDMTDEEIKSTAARITQSMLGQQSPQQVIDNPFDGLPQPKGVKAPKANILPTPRSLTPQLQTQPKAQLQNTSNKYLFQ